MPRLRVAPEGVGLHLWLVPDRKPPQPVEIDDLDLSDALMDRIEAWGDSFDAIFDEADPSASSFPSAEAEAGWRAEGNQIVMALRDELGEDWDVEARF